MIERAKDPLVKYIMVKDTKRLYRSSAVAYEFKETLKKYGLKLILLSTGQISDPNANDIGTQMMFGIESVSYTHLDVYKRQDWIPINYSIIGWKRTNQWEDGFYRYIEDEIEEKLLFPRMYRIRNCLSYLMIYICLLYTSRCV